MNRGAVSLREFLATGRLDGLRAGMSKLEVEDLLGPPHDTGGVPFDREHPSIYVYRDLEIHFGGEDRNRTAAVQIESRSSGGQYRLPSPWAVQDWALRPRQTAAQVRRFLEESSIAFEAFDPTSGLTERFVTDPARVEIVFDDEGRLDAIGANLPA